MKLSAIAEKVLGVTGQNVGFTVKSSVTGNLLKVIAKTPNGNFLVTKLSGKNAGKESLIEDTDRYELVDDAATKKAKRIEVIKAELKALGAQSNEIDGKMQVLEDELEGLEGAG
jgi:hypothetical protein